MCHNSFFSQYFVNPNVPGTVLGSRDTLVTRTNKLKAMLICMQLWFSSVEHIVSKISQLYISCYLVINVVEKNNSDGVVGVLSMVVRGCLTKGAC